MSKTTTSEFVPGMAYEQIMQADFVTCTGKALKALSDDAKAARVALKDAEKRRKGRGYRYLVTVDLDAASYLCDWFTEFLTTPAYSDLSTAQALAMRTVADRFCDFTAACKQEKVERKSAMQARVERMQQGKERKRQEREREAQTLAEQEAREALPKIEADLAKWEKEYAKVMDKAAKTKDMNKANPLYDQADRLQAQMIMGERRLRKLRNLAA